MTDRVKMTVLPPRDEARVPRELARRNGRSMTEMIRRAIALEKFVDNVAREDGKVLIRHKDHREREVILRSSLPMCLGR